MSQISLEYYQARSEEGRDYLGAWHIGGNYLSDDDINIRFTICGTGVCPVYRANQFRHYSLVVWTDLKTNKY